MVNIEKKVTFDFTYEYFTNGSISLSTMRIYKNRGEEKSGQYCNEKNAGLIFCYKLRRMGLYKIN